MRRLVLAALAVSSVAFSQTPGRDGREERRDQREANKDHAEYVAKYADGIKAIGSDPEKFARDYSVPLRIRFTKVRGG